MEAMVHGGKVATAWVLYYGAECWNNKNKACVKMCEAQNFYAVQKINSFPTKTLKLK